MNTYIYTIPLDCGTFVRAAVEARDEDVARDNLQQGKYELLDIHHLLVIDDAELAFAYDKNGDVLKGVV